VLSTLLDSTAALIASFAMVLVIVVLYPTGLLGRSVR
jgi:branched-chain amino acid transport system permease protein